jgi:hypothetical protein
MIKYFDIDRKIAINSTITALLNNAKVRIKIFHKSRQASKMNV